MSYEYSKVISNVVHSDRGIHCLPAAFKNLLSERDPVCETAP